MKLGKTVIIGVRKTKTDFTGPYRKCAALRVRTLPSCHPLHPHASVFHPHQNPETDQVVNRKGKFAAHRSKEKERPKQREGWGGSSYCRKYYIQSKYYFISSLLKETQHVQDGTKSNACSSTSKLNRMKEEVKICV